jgi:hypothetical protein
MIHYRTLFDELLQPADEAKVEPGKVQPINQKRKIAQERAS